MRLRLFMLLLWSARIFAEPLPKVEELMDCVVEQEDRNFEQARQWEFDQRLVTQRLNGDGEVESEKIKTEVYRPEGRLSFSVGGLKGQGEKAEVGVGRVDSKTKTEEGRFSEAMRLRELRPFYRFSLAGEGEYAGLKVWFLDFEPKPDVKVEGDRQQKVLAHLQGRFWINQADAAVIRADCSLVRPMPFAWFDLVSLRELKIQYETLHHEEKVWLPKSLEVFYKVRIMFISHIRERQMMTASDYRRIPEGQPMDEPKPESAPETSGPEREASIPKSRLL